MLFLSKVFYSCSWVFPMFPMFFLVSCAEGFSFTFALGCHWTICLRAMYVTFGFQRTRLYVLETQISLKPILSATIKTYRILRFLGTQLPPWIPVVWELKYPLLGIYQFQSLKIRAECHISCVQLKYFFALTSPSRQFSFFRYYNNSPSFPLGNFCQCFSFPLFWTLFPGCALPVYQCRFSTGAISLCYTDQSCPQTKRLSCWILCPFLFGYHLKQRGINGSFAAISVLSQQTYILCLSLWI